MPGSCARSASRAEARSRALLAMPAILRRPSPWYRGSYLTLNARSAARAVRTASSSLLMRMAGMGQICDRADATASCSAALRTQPDTVTVPSRDRATCSREASPMRSNTAEIWPTDFSAAARRGSGVGARLAVDGGISASAMATMIVRATAPSPSAIGQESRLRRRPGAGGSGSLRSSWLSSSAADTGAALAGAAGGGGVSVSGSGEAALAGAVGPDSGSRGHGSPRRATVIQTGPSGTGRLNGVPGGASGAPSPSARSQPSAPMRTRAARGPMPSSASTTSQAGSAPSAAPSSTRQRASRCKPLRTRSSSASLMARLRCAARS
ncbi:hypothetical protein D9M72_103040 [compost metagenome]